ncbi:MAG TPA: serine hydrolase [Xanthomonadaceae bacterium]|nr:serine hydrolase [Xanthomonadaceae bacterium]
MNLQPLRTWTLTIALLATATAVSAPSLAHDGLVRTQASDAQAKADAFDAIMRGHGIPGAQLLWSHAGTSEEFDYGVTRLHAADKVTPDTVFEAASLSKVLAAYIVMRMVDAGQMDLDTPLWNYWHSPRTRDNPQARRITTRMVLDHTTGLKNWQVSPSSPAIDTAPLESLFEPGARYSYSGEGFYLLQKTVEHITGTAWNELAGKEVFARFDMPDSSYVAVPAQESHRARGHDADGVPDDGPGYAHANTAYTLVTNARDYGNFIRGALFEGKGLAPATHALMLAAASDADDHAVPSPADPYVSWGLGVGLQKVAGRTLVWHWGDNPGYKAFFVLDPASGDNLILFTNSDKGLSTYKQVLNLFFGKGDYPAVDWARSQS